jgi:hypothetical protein
MTAFLYYAYGVVSASAPGAVHDVRGIGSREVELFSGPRLAMAVSPVPAAEFEQPALDKHLEDADWTARLATSHFETVAALHASAAPLLPFRLCTVFRGAGRALAALEANAAPLEAALTTVTGCAEWSVSARAVERPPRGDVGASASGAEYLRRVASRNRQRVDAASVAQDAVRLLHRRLGEVAVASDPPGEQAAGTRGAYLVRERDVPRFLDVVRAGERGTPRVDTEVRGPWAPYSFVPALREAA